MSLKKERREEIENALINAIGEHFTTKKVPINQKEFANACGVSVQSISRILKMLEESGRVLKQKEGRINVFSLPTEKKFLEYKIKGLAEDRVYNELVADFIRDTPKYARDNFAYAFLEILNNAIEHSAGTKVQVVILRNECLLSFIIVDDGVGVFTKVAEALNLEEKRYAIVELAKGKFTSDPDNHSGEGIFFSSKCGDVFVLESDGIAFFADHTTELLHDIVSEKHPGTTVVFKIRTNHKQTMEELFKQYTDAPERYGFSKTSIPIRLLEYGDASPIFVSRSQARRLLARLERFEVVRLDFSGVDNIGQGFADEIFRVFQKKHPDVELTYVNCTEAVHGMIRHVLEYK